MLNKDIVIVGGGIAGLTAAIFAARAGKRTVLIEKQERLGGRGMTNKKNGTYFNLGGHALYQGDAYETFREIGLRLQGGQPSIDAYGIWKDKLQVMPTGLGSLIKTPLLTWRGKMEFAGWLTKFGKLETHTYDKMSLREWVETHVQDPMVRHMFYSLLRTASYVMAPDLQAAGPVLRQFISALRGVLYIDRGWGSIVEEMREVASKLGVHIMTKSKVVSIEHREGRVAHVLCEDATTIEAANVIVTAPPAVLHQLVPHAEATAIQIWKEQAIEVTGACLDVVLRRLPQPKHQFVYGLDQPIFLSNQSRAAMMNEDHAQVVSLIKYQGTEKDPKKDLLDLERALDLIQPGWRNELIDKQYLPKIPVCYDFAHVKRQAEPGPAVPEITGLYVAGDWATHGELLVDAATASAKRAVQHILTHEGMERVQRDIHRIII